MKAVFSVKLGNGFSFGVEGDVSTLADVRKLLKKADAKMQNAVKALPEIGQEKVARGKFEIEQPAKAAATA